MGFALGAAIACLVLVPAAQAALGFQGLSAAPTNTNAGAHSDLNIHIGFTGASDDVKDLTVSLPPGMVGNPTATPLCTLTQLQGDSCPAATQVGTTTANVTAHLADPLPLTLPLTVNGSVYNVEPAAGEPARFGIVLRPVGSDPLPVFQKIIQVSDVRLRQSDFGLDTVLTNIPERGSRAGRGSERSHRHQLDRPQPQGNRRRQALPAEPDLLREQGHEVRRRLLRKPQPDDQGPGLVQLGQLRIAAVLADVHGRGRLEGSHGLRHQALH